MVAGTAIVAGCSGLSSDGTSDGGSDGNSDGSDGGSGESDGESGNGDDSGGNTDTQSPDTPTATPSPTAAETATQGGGGTDQASIRTPGPDDDHDWEALADREETSGFDLPEGAPTAWGYTRVSGDNTMTVSYGSMTGSEPVESGTVYAMFVVDDSVESVVVWESTIESGDEVLVGPDDSVAPMDVASVTNLVIAWESESEIYIVSRNDQRL